MKPLANEWQVRSETDGETIIGVIYPDAPYNVTAAIREARRVGYHIPVNIAMDLIKQYDSYK